MGISGKWPRTALHLHQTAESMLQRGITLFGVLSAGICLDPCSWPFSGQPFSGWPWLVLEWLGHVAHLCTQLCYFGVLWKGPKTILSWSFLYFSTEVLLLGSGSMLGMPISGGWGSSDFPGYPPMHASTPNSTFSAWAVGTRGLCFLKSQGNLAFKWFLQMGAVHACSPNADFAPWGAGIHSFHLKKK